MQQEQPGRVGRRLAAIVAGDVASYSRLMGLDEVGTARTLREHRAVTQQQRRCEPGAWEKPCKAMEFIVNTVVLSTDRACRAITHAKKPVYGATTAIE